MNKIPLERGFDILLALNDDDLSHMRRVDRHYNAICQEDYFWRQRVKRYYGPFIHLIKYFDTWKYFYHIISRHSAYVVVQKEVSIANDINTAYKMFLDFLIGAVDYQNYKVKQIEDVSRLEEIKDRIGKSPIQIYILLNGIHVHLGDPDFLLLSLGGSSDYLPPHLKNKFYVHNDLPYLPPLLSEGEFIQFYHSHHNLNNIIDWGRYWSNMHEISIEIGRTSQETMDKMRTY